MIHNKLFKEAFLAGVSSDRFCFYCLIFPIRFHLLTALNETFINIFQSQKLFTLISNAFNRLDISILIKSRPLSTSCTKVNFPIKGDLYLK